MRNNHDPLVYLPSTVNGARKVMVAGGNANLFSHLRAELIGSERRPVFCRRPREREEMRLSAGEMQPLAHVLQTS